MAAAAASQISKPVGTRTASTSAPETARGTHTFTIARYSLHRGLGVGKFFRSASFRVGGYDWCIRFYPDGFKSSGDNAASVALFLELRNTEAEVRASFEFSLVDQATGQSTVFSHPSEAAEAKTSVFAAPKSGSNDGTGYKLAWGTKGNKKRSELEASAFLRDDCLVVECDVTVIVNEHDLEHDRDVFSDEILFVGFEPSFEEISLWDSVLDYL